MNNYYCRLENIELILRTDNVFSAILMLATNFPYELFEVARLATKHDMQRLKAEIIFNKSKGKEDVIVQKKENPN